MKNNQLHVRLYRCVQIHNFHKIFELRTTSCKSKGMVKEYHAKWLSNLTTLFLWHNDNDKIIVVVIIGNYRLGGGGVLMARKRDTIQPETFETHGLWVAHHTPLHRSLCVCLM
jgi:hypothetical protein